MKAWIVRHRDIVVIAAFALAVLPVLPNSHTYLGDEHFYTDGALAMLRTGDYLTPVYSDGRLRFNKPVLTYWTAAATFKALGVSTWSARLGCLIAGCLTLWLSRQLAWELFRNRAVASLSLLFLAAGLPLYESSARLNPDIFLTLFITMSLLGSVRLLAGGPGRTRAAFMAYVGAGLAMETKGFLGLLGLAYPFLFCLLLPDRRLLCRRLFHLPAILTGALVGLGWYGLMYGLHGDAALREFLADQVTGRLESPDRLLFLNNLMAYAGAMLLAFFPWWVFALGRFRSRWRVGEPETPGHTSPIRFATGWVLLVMLIMSMGNLMRGRYMLPVYPCLSSLLGLAVFRSIESGGVGKTSAFLCRWAGFVLGAIGLVLCLLGGRLFGWGAILAGVIMLALALLAGSASRWPGIHYRLAAVASVCLVLYLLANAILRPVIGATPTHALAARLAGLRPAPESVLTLGMPKKYAGQLRVLLEDSIAIRRLPQTRPGEEFPDDVIIFPAGLEPAPALAGRSIQTSGYEYAVLTLPDILNVLTSPAPPAVTLAGYRISFCIAVRVTAMED